jgi:hypothetical protein
MRVFFDTSALTKRYGDEQGAEAADREGLVAVDLSPLISGRRVGEP